LFFRKGAASFCGPSSLSEDDFEEIFNLPDISADLYIFVYESVYFYLICLQYWG